MPLPSHRPVELRRRVFRGSEMVAGGKLTQGDLRGPVWRRLFRDVYACPDLPITHRVRALAASRLLVPGSVVTGRSAAALWGVLEARPDDHIELTVPPGSNASLVSGTVVRRRLLDPRPGGTASGRRRPSGPPSTSHGPDRWTMPSSSSTSSSTRG